MRHLYALPLPQRCHAERLGYLPREEQCPDQQVSHCAVPQVVRTKGRQQIAKLHDALSGDIYSDQTQASHHLCVNVAVYGSSVLVSQLLLGFHPATVRTPYGQAMAPPESDEILARNLLHALPRPG